MILIPFPEFGNNGCTTGEFVVHSLVRPTGLLFSRREEQGRLDQLRTLVKAIVEEDRCLRQLMAAFPRSSLDVGIRAESLSFKDTLGHLAFWDDFTSHFFRCKVDPLSCQVPPPADFEKSSREAMEAMSKRPFGEVLARYLEATGSLLEFLEKYWNDLSEKDRSNFWVPLKHRRQHRLALAEDLQQLRLTEAGQEPRAMSAPA